MITYVKMPISEFKYFEIFLKFEFGNDFTKESSDKKLVINEFISLLFLIAS